MEGGGWRVGGGVWGENVDDEGVDFHRMNASSQRNIDGSGCGVVRVPEVAHGGENGRGRGRMGDGKSQGSRLRESSRSHVPQMPTIMNLFVPINGTGCAVPRL